MTKFFRQIGFIHIVLAFGLIVFIAIVYANLNTSPIDNETLLHIERANNTHPENIERNRMQILFMQERIWFFMFFATLSLAIMIWIGLKAQQPRGKSFAGYHFKLNESIHKQIKQRLNFNEQLSLKFDGLTPNDLLIAEMLVDGLSSKDISLELNISPASVNTARYRLRKKMALDSDTDLVEFLKNI